MAAIEMEGLRKVYGEDVVAVDDLDLVVETGEVYGFLGPNGAGKSTTIGILLDFVHPTAGSARVLGHDTREESLSLRQRIGILPEGASPYERLTGQEHLELAAGLKGVEADADAILDRVGLDPADARRNAGDYSKGMAQRLGLGMALVGDPDLLILDEPSSGLDPTGMGEMRDLIREEASSGTTVFFSSHLLAEVEAVCDRIGILSDGRLVAEDTIDALRDRFVGECTIEVSVDADPEGLVPVEVEGVVDTTVEGDTVAVACEDPTVKADVVRWIDERTRVTDIISEETSLEVMFEQYTGVSPETGESGESKPEAPPEVAR